MEKTYIYGEKKKKNIVVIFNLGECICLCCVNINMLIYKIMCTQLNNCALHISCYTTKCWAQTYSIAFTLVLFRSSHSFSLCPTIPLNNPYHRNVLIYSSQSLLTSFFLILSSCFFSFWSALQTGFEKRGLGEMLWQILKEENYSYFKKVSREKSDV